MRVIMITLVGKGEAMINETGCERREVVLCDQKSLSLSLFFSADCGLRGNQVGYAHSYLLTGPMSETTIDLKVRPKGGCQPRTHWNSDKRQRTLSLSERAWSLTGPWLMKTVLTGPR